MASTILEQILENVSRGARLPQGQAAATPPPPPPPAARAPAPASRPGPLEDAGALMRVVIDEVDLRLARLVERVLTHPALRERAAAAPPPPLGERGPRILAPAGTEPIDIARAASFQARDFLMRVDPRRAPGTAAAGPSEPARAAPSAPAAVERAALPAESPAAASPRPARREEPAETPVGTKIAPSAPPSAAEESAELPDTAEILQGSLPDSLRENELDRAATMASVDAEPPVVEDSVEPPAGSGEDTDEVFFLPAEDLLADWEEIEAEESAVSLSRPDGLESLECVLAGGERAEDPSAEPEPPPPGSPGRPAPRGGARILDPSLRDGRLPERPPVASLRPEPSVVEQVEAIVEEIAETCRSTPAESRAPANDDGEVGAALDEIRGLLAPLSHLPELLANQGAPQRQILEQMQSLAREVREIARTPRAAAPADTGAADVEEAAIAKRRRRVAIDDIQGMIESLS